MVSSHQKINLDDADITKLAKSYHGKYCHMVDEEALNLLFEIGLIGVEFDEHTLTHYCVFKDNVAKL